MGRIVVGLDGSKHGEYALAWAAAHARVTGDGLEVVTAVTAPMVGDPMMGYVALEEDHQARIASLQAAEVAAAGVEDLQVTCVRPDGPAARVLLERATAADLLVVGTRGHGALASAILGSITHQLATHTPCPLVAVPVEAGPLRRVVVGVDGSSSGARAVTWAAEVARARDAAVELVAVYEAIGTHITSPWMPTVPFPDPTQLRGAMTSVLDDVVAAAAASLAGLQVERIVLEGRASVRLREHAEGADLLVVGNRGHGGFHDLLLGSTSHGCLTHPPCAVAIVPGDR